MSPEEITLKIYFDSKFEDLKEYFEAQNKSLRDLQTEKDRSTALALEKATKEMENHFKSLNQWREQNKDERAEYQKRDTCVGQIKTCDTRIKILETKGAFQSGREWLAIAVIAAIPTLLGIINLIRG